MPSDDRLPGGGDARLRAEREAEEQTQHGALHGRCGVYMCEGQSEFECLIQDGQIKYGFQ